MTSIVAEEISNDVHGYTYALTFYDDNNNVVKDEVVMGTEMPYIENDCKAMGWTLTYRHGS